MNSEKMNLDEIVDGILVSKPTFILMGTHVYVHLSQSERFKNLRPEQLESIMFLIPTGAFIPRPCEEVFRAKLPNFRCVINVYGSTELPVMTIGHSPTSHAVPPGTTIKVT